MSIIHKPIRTTRVEFETEEEMNKFLENLGKKDLSEEMNRMREMLKLHRKNRQDAQLNLYIFAIKKRRKYLRNILSQLDTSNREVQPKIYKSIRQGMLSELSLMECVFTEIQEGKFDIDKAWNIED
ncbi:MULTISPECIES: hypothetical protein [unclassified Paenibacillus]|uniref:hypothetical protein n=1 Tax=unclassified Paenibacillus TaxID=185978 RepID=UPI0036D2BD24